MTIIWIILLVVLSIIEVSTVNLVTIWFIASSFVALILSIFNVNIFIQFAVFVLLGVFLLITTRETLVKLLNKTKQKTNYDRILDMKGIVTESIKPDEIGEVKVDGKKWSAVSTKEISLGKKVKIIKIEGVKLFVEEDKNE